MRETGCVLVYGLGITGVSSAEVLMARGIAVDLFIDPVTDETERIRQDEQVAKLKAKSGNSALKCFERVSDIDWGSYDFILKSPGIRLDRPLLTEAHAHGVEVITDIELAYRLFGGERMLAITGSNGKTTTVSLLTHLLNSAGYTAIAVGNIGTPILSSMAALPQRDFYVVECSSFQLSSVKTFSPRLSAILNLTPDHLEWHSSYEAYVEAKFNIASFADAEHPLYLNAEDPDTQRFYRKHLSARAIAEAVRFIDKTDNAWLSGLRARKGFQLYGEHNVENALFAIAVAETLGLSEGQIRAGLAAFKPVAHRMEKVAVVDGVEYINDSKGTNVDATVRALAGIDRPVLLIAGGYDKKVPFDALFKAFRAHGKKLILMGETKDQLYEQACACGMANLAICVSDMEEAVAFARAQAQEGDIVLLSPASASWDMYPGYACRGNAFKSLVLALTEDQGEITQAQIN